MEARAKEIEKFGLTSIEHRVLLQIPIMEQMMGRKVRASDMSRWLFRRRSTISELLTRMEIRGLVRRIPQPGNRKSSMIEITEKGRELSEKGYKEGMTIVHEAMSTINEEERHQLWIIAGKLRKVALNRLELSKKPPFPQFL